MALAKTIRPPEQGSARPLGRSTLRPPAAEPTGFATDVVYDVKCDLTAPSGAVDETRPTVSRVEVAVPDPEK